MSESKTQCQKYIIIDGALANAATREFIPVDEPIILLRGKDKHAMTALGAYHTACQDKSHKEAVAACMQEFYDFSESHPDVMGEPDTYSESEMDNDAGDGIDASKEVETEEE